MKRIFTLLLLAALSTAVYAAASNESYAGITKIRVKGDGDVLLYVPEIEHTDCGASTAYVIPASSSPVYRSQFELAKMAYAEGFDVTINHVDGQCDGVNPIVKWISVDIQESNGGGGCGSGLHQCP